MISYSAIKRYEQDAMNLIKIGKYIADKRKALGIRINEFLAGEDIREENYIQKSEDNLIQIAKDSKYRIKNLKRSIVGLAFIVLITLFLLGMILAQNVVTQRIKLIVTDTSAKYSTTIPILEKVEGREYYGRSAVQIEEKVSIQKNSEQGLAAFILFMEKMV